MANSQTADWRLRETINKRIERQTREGYIPLTRYKSLYPYEEGSDIVDRRTGKVKLARTFVAEYMKARGVTRDAAMKAYSLRLHVLAEMNITRTKTVRDITHEQTNAVMQRFLASYTDPELQERAAEKLAKMSDIEKLNAIRDAKRRSCPGGHYTVSFFDMIAEYLGVDVPASNTP